MSVSALLISGLDRSTAITDFSAADHERPSASSAAMASILKDEAGDDAETPAELDSPHAVFSTR